MGRGGLKLLKKPSYDIWTFLCVINRIIQALSLLSVVFGHGYQAQSNFMYTFDISQNFSFWICAQES